MFGSTGPVHERTIRHRREAIQCMLYNHRISCSLVPHTVHEINQPAIEALKSQREGPIVEEPAFLQCCLQT